MEITETCTRCGTESTFTIPDDHDGTRILWECPGTLEDGTTCGMRNIIDGEDPAAAAIALAAVNEPDVTLVVDGEDITGGDDHS